MLKKKIVISVLIVVLLIGTVAAIAHFFDLNNFKPFISQTVKHYTGRELTINGDIRTLALWPLTFEAENIAWQNAPWGSRPNMVRAKRAAFAISLTSLLRREFRFFNIRFDEPDVFLEFNRAGVSNFLLDIPETEGEGVVPVLAFRDIFIQNGYFEYNDQRWDLNASVNVNELTADIPGLDKPLEILFEGSFRDLPCTLEGSIGPIMAWIQPDRILPMDLKARLGNASARLAGNIRNAAHFTDISLVFTASGPSTREMAELVGRGADPELGSFTATAELTDQSGHLAIEKLSATIGSPEQVSFSAAGKIGDLIELKGFDLKLGLQTRHTGNLMLLAGLPPPPFEAPFSANVTFSDTTGKNYSLDDVVVRMGDQTIQGRMDLDLTRSHPILDMHLRTEHATLGPVDLKTRVRGSLDRVGVEQLELQMGHDGLFKTFVGGTIDNLSPLEGLHLNCNIVGNDLAKLQKVAGRPLPVHGPFALSGALRMADRHAVQVHDLKIILGRNSINGSLELDMAHEVPILHGDLVSNRLNIQRLLKPGTLPAKLQENLSSVGPSRLAFEVSGPLEKPVLNKIDIQSRVEDLAIFNIKGAIENLLTMTGTDLQFMVKGNELRDLTKVVGQDIPLKGPFMLSGSLSTPAKQTFHFENLKISVPYNTFSGRSAIQLSELGTTASVKLAANNISLEALAEGQHVLLNRLRSEKNLGPLDIEATANLSENGFQLQSLDLSIGTDDFVRMQLEGLVENLQDLRDIQLHFQISGRNISSLESIAGRTIPVEGSYELSGDVSGHAPANIMLRNLDLKLAQNHFAGQATLNLVDEIPLIDAEITADFFSLAPVTIEEFDPLKNIADLGPLKLAFTLSEKEGKPALTQLDLRLGTESTIVAGLNGTIGNLTPIGDISLDFEIHSQDLASLNNAHVSRFGKGIPFKIMGRLDAPRSDKISVTALEAFYGDSDLSGTASLDYSGNQPSLVARLSSRRMDLRPFFKTLDRGGAPTQAPASSKSPDNRVLSGEDSNPRLFLKKPDQDDSPPQMMAPLKKPGKRVFSHKHFDLAPLQQITAHVAFQAEELLAKRLAFNDVDIRLKLKQGNLDVDPLNFRIGGGTAEGAFSLQTENSPPFMATSLAVHQFDIGPMLEQLEQASSLQGMLNTSIHLDSRGSSVAALMAGLNGNVHLDIHDGQIESKHLTLLERYLGSNILDIINPFIKRPPHTPINCFISATTFKDGLAEFKMILDTEQTALASAGTINLKTEHLDIGIKPSPKKGFGDANVGYISLSLSKLSQPFGLGGTLANPQLVLDPTRTVVTAAKFAGAAVLGPLGLALFFTDISLGKKNICEEATQAMRKK